METLTEWATEHGVTVLRFGNESCEGEVWADTSGLVVKAWMDGGHNEQGAVIPWEVIDQMRRHGSAGVRFSDSTDVVAADTNPHRAAGGCSMCPGGMHFDERNGPAEVLPSGAHRHAVPVDVPPTVVEWPEVASR